MGEKELKDYELPIRSLAGMIVGGTDETNVVCFEDLPNNVIDGKYMAIRLRGVFSHVPLENQDSDAKVLFSIVEVELLNKWMFVLPAGESPVTMIDSDGYQLADVLCSWEYVPYSFVSKQGHSIPYDFDEPPLKLEGGARTRGCFRFREESPDATPKRLNFDIRVFEPGQTSGWVKDSEQLTFFINSSPPDTTNLLR